MSNDDKSDKGRQPLPSRYTADDKRARWRRLWLWDNNSDGHADDDGADPYRGVDGGLPPLPDAVRDEGKYSGRRPDGGGGQQLCGPRPCYLSR